MIDGRAVLVDETKTTTSVRGLDLPDRVVDVLSRQRKEQRAERVAARRWDDDRLVFPTSVGTPLPAPNVRRALAELCEHHGLGDWRPNELRHTCASLMADQGAYLDDIAQTLGHTTTRMVERTYRHALRPTVRGSRDVMNGLFGRGVVGR
jgi:integrase